MPVRYRSVNLQYVSLCLPPPCSTLLRGARTIGGALAGQSNSGSSRGNGGAVCTIPLYTPSRYIIVPRQLKAYGSSFSPSIGERNADVASHLVLQSLTSTTRLAKSPLLRKPVKTTCVESFDDMLLIPELREALEKTFQITTPSPIQQSAIETILQRRSTVVAAPHGEGKTLAYLLPLFQLMVKDRDVYKIPLRERRPRLLVLAPTRELVEQLHHICDELGRHTGLSTLSFTSRPRSKYHLSRLMKQRMADIVVMDPKLLLRLIRARRLFIDDLRYVAVDEADALLSTMHDKDAAQLLAKVRKRNMYQHLWPVQTQVVFSTAYITRGVEHYVGRRFPDAVTCLFKQDMHRPPPTLQHHFYPIQRENEKFTVLLHLLRRHGHVSRPVLTDEAEVEVHRHPYKLSGSLESAQAAARTEAMVDDAHEQERTSNGERSASHSEASDAERDTDIVRVKGVRTVSPESASGETSTTLVETRPGAMSSTSREEEELIWNRYRADVPLRFALERVRPVHWHHLATTAAPFTGGGKVRRTVFAPGRRTIVFTRHLDSATAIFHQLRAEGFAVSLLHAALPRKVRRDMYADFCSGRTNILCATDLASRGLDIHVDLVINFDMPTNALTYLSRAGRTSRMGRVGKVCSLYSKYQGTIVAAIKSFVQHRVPLEGVTNRSKDMTTPRYAEWRTHKTNALTRAYVSMITTKVIPAHLERSYVHHNSTWRPLFHPQTISAHAGVPPRQQQKLMDRVRAQAVWYRRGQLARRKGGRAKFGRRDMRLGVWNDIGGVASKAVANHQQSPNPGGVGPPSGPPSS